MRQVGERHPMGSNVGSFDPVMTGGPLAHQLNIRSYHCIRKQMELDDYCVILELHIIRMMRI